MLDQVLIGVDGRCGGDDAVALARQLAAPGARVTLAQIYGEAGWPPASAQFFLDEQRTEAQALLDRKRQEWPGAQTACASAATVGRGLHELAVERNADLLVVGSTHRGLPGRVLVGDNARAALNGAPCAIAIAPRGYADAPVTLRRVGVGYNGTPDSERALLAARAIAERAGASVAALWVIGRQDVRRDAPLPADWPLASDLLLDEAERRLAAIDDVEGVVLLGGPREELRRLADEVDLLVVGSRGYGPLGSLMHGSVSSYLERHAASALLVLPRACAAGASSGAPADEAALVA